MRLLRVFFQIFIFFSKVASLARFESIENIRVSSQSQNIVRIDLDIFNATLNDEITHKV